MKHIVVSKDEKKCSLIRESACGIIDFQKLKTERVVVFIKKMISKVKL